MKKIYIKPETEWFHVGLEEDWCETVQDSTTGGVEGDLARENNVWADDDSDNSSSSKSLWDNQW